MGCGASASQQRYKSGKSGDAFGASTSYKEADSEPEDGVTARGKDCTWHRENCSDADLWKAQNASEAYPANEKDKTVITKNLKRGVEHVSVFATGRKSIACSECGDHILNRGEQGCFFFCLRCRKEGKQFNLCVRCYSKLVATAGGQQKRKSDGTSIGMVSQRSSVGRPTTPHERRLMDEDALMPGHPSTGSPRPGSANRQHLNDRLNPDELRRSRPNSATSPRSRPSSANSLTRPASAKGSPMASPRASPGNSPRASSRGSPAASPRASPIYPHAELSEEALPSGQWRGKLLEGASKRDAAYTLYFNPDFSLEGSGPEGCVVAGSAGKTISALHNSSKVTWTESHDWGDITVTGEIFSSDTPMRILGKFTATDGGGGKIELRFASKK